ncbi:MAG: GNAT family N-acetyltransferase [Planctomycetota bacterium]
MITNVPRDRRAALAPLFADFPGVQGMLASALSGAMGVAWADDADQPAVAHLSIYFHLLAGDPSHPAARVMVSRLPQPATVIVPQTQEWFELLASVWHRALEPVDRALMVPPPKWNKEQLLRKVERLPDRFALRKPAHNDLADLLAFDDLLAVCFADPAELIDRGACRFAQREGSRDIAAACSTAAISSALPPGARAFIAQQDHDDHAMAELEISTAAIFRRRGLGSAVAASVILDCLERDTTPCWDAFNPESQALATSLGYADAKPYTAFFLCRTA